MAEAALAEPTQASAQRPREARQITPERMQPEEFARTSWFITAHFGTAVEDLLAPGYWAGMAQKMKVSDKIEAWVDDGTWIAELRVLEVAHNWARVIILSQHRLDSPEALRPAVAEEYRVEWKGPHLKFCVVRTRDGAYLSKVHRNREVAEDALRALQRTMSAQSSA